MAMTGLQKKILKILQNGTPINGELISHLIHNHRHTHERTKSLYERYKATGQGVPIFTRQMPNASKINSKINNDFFGEIIDTKVGYMAGIPINYDLDKTQYEDQTSQLSNQLNYKRHTDALNKFKLRNNTSDIDAELVKLVSISGHAGREIYIDKEGNERVANLYPWETIFLTTTHNEVEYALRYIAFREKGEVKYKVEFFDGTNVTYYVEEDSGGKTNKERTFILDLSEPVNPKPHLFDYCPIVKVVNNEEELGDADKVLQLIDAYDRALSDVNSEIEQFRLAYMYFKGAEPTEEVIEKAKQTGGYYVGEQGEVGFITKNINDSVVEHHLDRLEENILRFAKSVNFTEDAFGGNLSGVAMQYKLMALENKSSTLETKMTTALRQQFKIVASAWKKKSIDLDYLDVFFTFKRNLPVNLLDEADTSAKLKGLVSERTRLGKLSFVDDVDYELEQMAQDAEGAINLDDVNAQDQFPQLNGDTTGGDVNGNGQG